MALIMDEQTKQKLFEDIGYIKGKVEDIPKITERLDQVEDKVSHIYGYASGLGAFFGLAVALFKEWFFKSR